MRTVNGNRSRFPKVYLFRTTKLLLIIIHNPQKNQGCRWVEFIKNYYPSVFINVEKSSEYCHTKLIIVHWNLLSVGQVHVDIRTIRFSTKNVSTKDKIILTETLTQTTVFEHATRSDKIHRQHVTQIIHNQVRRST